MLDCPTGPNIITRVREGQWGRGGERDGMRLVVKMEEVTGQALL